MKNSEFKQWEKMLKQNGARITKARKAIMLVLAESRHPLTAMEVFSKAKQDAPSLGLVTVYRTIEKLKSLGLLEHIHGHDQCQSVFRAASGHRHLLICSNCGKSIYFDGLPAEEAFNQIGRDNGFIIEDHMLQLYGICENCRQKEF